MNPAAEELTGYSFKEAKEKINTEDLYTPGQAKETMKNLRDEGLGGKGKLHLSRATLVNAQGEEIPVELTAAIIYEGDQEVATVGLFNDLREKLKHEQSMRELRLRIYRAEKMASLGHLAAGVAHEINNPLLGIIFYSYSLMQTLQKDDQRLYNLQCIYEDAKRCGKIIKNLLAYSRQETPKDEILHINNLVEHGLDLIRDTNLFKGIQIRKELSEEIMLIHGDRDQLGQVIVNLIMNAVDAMEQKGILTLRTLPKKSRAKSFYRSIRHRAGNSKSEPPFDIRSFFYHQSSGKRYRTRIEHRLWHSQRK